MGVEGVGSGVGGAGREVRGVEQEWWSRMGGVGRRVGVEWEW